MHKMLLLAALMGMLCVSRTWAEAGDDDLFLANGKCVADLRLGESSLKSIRAKARPLNEWIGLAGSGNAKDVDEASRALSAIAAYGGLESSQCEKVFDDAVTLTSADQPHQRAAGAALLGRTAITAYQRQKECLAVLLPLGSDKDKSVREAAINAVRRIESENKKREDEKNGKNEK